MSITHRPTLDPSSCAIASESLSAFVEKAEEVLRTGRNVLNVIVPEGQKIGDIFARAVVDAAVSSQIEAVEKRYGISLSKISNQVNCLRVQDILAFAYGILNPTNDTFCEISPSSIIPLSSKEREKAALAKEHFDSAAPLRASLGGRVSTINLENYANLISPEAFSNLTVDKLGHELSKQTLDINQLQEVLSKLFGTSALEEGMRIPLPSLISPVTNEKVVSSGYYQVHKKISQEGLMAFALSPIDAPEFIKPMVLFRPTALTAGEKNALKTIAEDMHDDVGKPGFLAAKDQLEMLLMDPFFIHPREKGWVTGFSLGGAHAARLLAFAPDKFSKAFFFNDPSTELQVANEFATRILHSTHSRENPLDIRIFHNESDDVTLAGACHVGYIPESHYAKERARSLCHVSYVKIRTRHMEELREDLHSIAQVDLSFRSLLSLASRANRIAAMQFAKIKMDIHCQIVLSSFNQKDEDPQPLAVDPASPRERAGSDPKSPRSLAVREERVVEVRYLDKSTCELSTQFNLKRLSRSITIARNIIKFSCRKFAEFKNVMSSIRKAIGGFFSRFSRTHSKSYVPLIEEKFKKLKERILQANLADLLAVPPAGNPQVRIRPVDLSEVFSFLSVPPASR